TVRAVQQQQLRIVSHRPPGVDEGLVQLLSAMRTFGADLEPLVTRDVLATHQPWSCAASSEVSARTGSRNFEGGGGGSHPALGGGSPPSGGPGSVHAGCGRRT